MVCIYRNCLPDIRSHRYIGTVMKRNSTFRATYDYLNPVLLLKQINENLEHLWNLAEHPVYQQRKDKTLKASVT